MDKITEGLTDGLKKVLYAGVGTVAVTAEKLKDVIDNMAEKGEITVEQGKVLNQELRHNIKKTVKENLNVSVKPNSPDELSELLEKMTPEQVEELKSQILKFQENLEQEKAEETPEAPAEEAATEEAPVEEVKADGEVNE